MAEALGALVALAIVVSNASATRDDVILVSRASGASGTAANGDSRDAHISADGRFVAFESDATNLSANDVNVSPDVFVRDLQAGTTALVSRAGGSGARGRARARPLPSVAHEPEATPGGPDGRMSGRVVARDARGNATTVRFRFTLKAPRSTRR